MAQIFINIPGSGGYEISGDYTLSHGITPGLITVQIPPAAGDIPEFTSVAFSDGDRVIVFQDCRLVNIPAHKDQSGDVWTLQVQDHRWRWACGYINGQYNYAADSTELTKPLPATIDLLARKTAMELAVMCVAAMGEADKIDVSAFSTVSDDYPQVHWDYANPAAELANLCERYGFILAYDPCALRGKVERCNSGPDPSFDWPVLSEDKTQALPPAPVSLLGIAEWSEYEVTLELEAVGLDTDGSIRTLDKLSYGPATKFETAVKNFPGLTGKDAAETAFIQKLAKKSVYKWYRIKGGQKVGTLNGGDVMTAEKILPAGNCRVLMGVQENSDGIKQMVRLPAYVKGVYWDGAMSRKNSDSTLKLEDFRLDEDRGIVEFNYPVLKADATNKTVGPADLKLRCTIWGERHTESLTVDVNGAGVVLVPCRGITAQFVMEDAEDGISADDNLAEVKAKMLKILDAKADEYLPRTEKTTVYAGIGDAKLNGKVHQVSWTVGPAGAMTTVSVNREHSIEVPREEERRKREKSRQPVTAGMRGPLAKEGPEIFRQYMTAAGGQFPGGGNTAAMESQKA